MLEGAVAPGSEPATCVTPPRPTSLVGKSPQTASMLVSLSRES